MARTVREIMNPELLSIRADTPSTETLDLILEFGVTAVPVLDDQRRPVGVSSLRDLVRMPPGKVPMTSPATTIDVGASITAAAETMARSGRHHLVVVGSDGRAVGMLSTLDVIRGLLGEPISHPATFPNLDATTGANWSSDEPVERSSAAALPQEPGVVVLVRGGAGRDERFVWVEDADDLRKRVLGWLDDGALDDGANEPVTLRDLLRQPNLRMRHCRLHAPEARRALTARLHARLASIPPTGGT